MRFFPKGWWFEHQERSRKRLFAFYRQGANDTANGPQVGPHPYKPRVRHAARHRATTRM